MNLERWIPVYTGMTWDGSNLIDTGIEALFTVQAGGQFTVD